MEPKPLLPAGQNHVTPQLSDIEARLKAFQKGAGADRGDHSLNPGMQASPAVRDAAVLILLIPREDGGYNILFTERTAHLHKHAGQNSFPGGGVEKQDKDISATALREAAEEIGLDPSNARVLGVLDDYITRTGFRVTPVVAVLEKPQDWAPQDSEVARIFEVPLEYILAPNNLKPESLSFEGGERFFYAIYHNGARIWGATAGMLKAFSDIISPPASDSPNSAPPSAARNNNNTFRNK